MKLTFAWIKTFSELPPDLQIAIWEWTLPQSEIVTFTSEGFGLASYRLEPPPPERFLLFEEGFEHPSNFSGRPLFRYPRIQDLPPEEKAVIVSFVFGPLPLEGRLGGSPVKRPTYKLHWIVKRWRGVNTFTQIQKRHDEFYKVNWQSKGLFCVRYNHKFLVRGTKVLILYGDLKGKHGVVIDTGTINHVSQVAPTVVILLANQQKVTTYQFNLQLVDPQGVLPFAIPFDPEDPVQKYKWGRSPVFNSGIVDQESWTPNPEGPIDPFEPPLHYLDEIGQEGIYKPLLLDGRHEWVKY